LKVVGKIFLPDLHARNKRENRNPDAIFFTLSFSPHLEATVGADGQIADTTQLLLAWAGGDAAALDALAPRIYKELHRLAVDFMKREREEPILQATALAGVYS
jgi:ECF sigma factor